MRLELPMPPPVAGVHLFDNPRLIPDEGCARLRNMRVDDGAVLSRAGFNTFLDTPNTNVVIDGFSVQFNDGTYRALRVTDATGTAGATSPIHYAASVWTAVTLDNTFGSGSKRFWARTCPWGTEIRGRVILSNNIKIKSWTGNPADSFTDVAGAFPSKFGIVAPDNRLILANLVEGGSQQLQRVRWSIIALTNGGAADWSATGSGALDLRNDGWSITGMWLQQGRIFIGKERSILVLLPTGVSTSAYGYDVLVQNGRGLFAPRSLIQYDNYVAFLTHDDFILFDGVNFTRIGGPVRTNLFRRLNYDALDRITVVADSSNRRVGWGLPLDGNVYPSEIWWLHMDDGHWEAGDSPAHSSIFAFVGVAPVTYGELPGIYGTYAGLAATTYGGIQPQTTPKPKIVLGFTNGKTWQSDATKATDINAPIPCEYISKAIVPVGQTISVGGRPHTITSKDQLVLDEVTLTILDRGTAQAFQIYATADDGKSWVFLGLLSLVTSGGSMTTPVMAEKSIHTRFAFKDHVQIRIVPVGPLKFGFTEGRVYITLAGRKQR